MLIRLWKTCLGCPLVGIQKGERGWGRNGGNCQELICPDLDRRREESATSSTAEGRKVTRHDPTSPGYSLAPIQSLLSFLGFLLQILCTCLFLYICPRCPLPLKGSPSDFLPNQTPKIFRIQLMAPPPAQSLPWLFSFQLLSLCIEFHCHYSWVASLRTGDLEFTKVAFKSQFYYGYLGELRQVT